MAHILVTGGAGFIGTHLCARLLREGHRVLCLDNLAGYGEVPARKHAHMRHLQTLAPEQFTFHRGDICDGTFLYAHVFRHKPPMDLLIHLAALAGVRPSLTHPLEYSTVNIQGTLTLLDWCRQSGMRHLIFASSSAVYGARHDGIPFTEDDDADHPISPYAATKRAGELLCATYAHLYQLRIACLRFFTVYGPGQRSDLAIHTFTRQMTTGQPLAVFGDGTSQRDYTYVDDIVDGILAAWRWLWQGNQAVGCCEPFNIGGGQPVTLLALIQHLETALGCPAQLDWRPAQPGDMPRTAADLAKATALLGYRPRVDLVSGLARFATWFRQQEGTKREKAVVK